MPNCTPPSTSETSFLQSPQHLSCTSRPRFPLFHFSSNRHSLMKLSLSTFRPIRDFCKKKEEKLVLHKELRKIFNWILLRNFHFHKETLQIHTDSKILQFLPFFWSEKLFKSIFLNDQISDVSYSSYAVKTPKVHKFYSTHNTSAADQETKLMQISLTGRWNALLLRLTLLVDRDVMSLAVWRTFRVSPRGPVQRTLVLIYVLAKRRDAAGKCSLRWVNNRWRTCLSLVWRTWLNTRWRSTYFLIGSFNNSISLHWFIVNWIR